MFDESETIMFSLLTTRVKVSIHHEQYEVHYAVVSGNLIL